MPSLIFVMRALSIGVCLVGLVAPVLGAPKVEEQVVGPVGKVMGMAISPRGAHHVALVQKGSRYAVIVDGVEGPKIDDYLGTIGAPSVPGGVQHPLQVAFSDDGTRWAYIAKVGDEYVVMADGKEFARGKLSPETSPHELKFSPGGKRLVYIVRYDAGGSVSVHVDGKPGPVAAFVSEISFSPDGMQYAYVGTQKDKPDQKWAVVGERQVKHFGDDLRFTGTGHLIATAIGSGVKALILDGKPAFQVADIRTVWVSRFSGGHVAALVVPKPGAPTVLVVNGKAVPDTQGCQIREVHFSPDGKRFAAECIPPTPGAEFMLVDGKKQQAYRAVLNFQFTPDSSKAIYNARTDAGQFVIVEGEESDGYMSLNPVVIGGGGKHVGFVGWNAAQQYFLVLDGKATQRKNPSSPTYSPDGSRWAFGESDRITSSLWIDGVEQPGFRVLPPQESAPHPDVRRVLRPGVGAVTAYDGRADAPLIAFSPDGKHYAHVGCPAGQPGEKRVVLDGKLLPKGDILANPWMPRFSPDNQHLFCVYQVTGGNFRLDVDGQPAVTFAPDTLCTLPGNWEMGSDGVLTFVAITDGVLKRYRVSASPDRNLDALLAGAGK